MKPRRQAAYPHFRLGFTFEFDDVGILVPGHLVGRPGHVRPHAAVTRVDKTTVLGKLAWDSGVRVGHFLAVVGTDLEGEGAKTACGLGAPRPPPLPAPPT